MKIDILQTYNVREYPYRQAASQEMINLYVLQNQANKSPLTAYLRPGFKHLQDLPQGSEIRLLLAEKDRAYAVSSANVYELDTVLATTHINAGQPLATANGRIDASINQNNELFLTDGAKGYVYQENGGTWNEVTDTHFPTNPVGSAYFYGHNITGESGTNRVYLSELNDALTWNSNGTAREIQLNYRKDEIQQIRVLGQQIYFFMNFVTEVWYNPGKPGLIPFRRNTNRSFEYGTPAPESAVSSHQILVWLAQEQNGHPSVKMTEGGDLKTLSNTALENEWASYSDLTDARAFTYKLDGQLFYQLTFPTADRTWVYNFNSHIWTRYESEKSGRFQANAHMFFTRQHIIGDFESSAIYELSSKYYDDNGSLYRWRLQSAHFYDEKDYRRLGLTSLELDMVNGYAPVNGQRAVVYLSVSKDGGISYGKPKIRQQTKTGVYRSRLRFYQLGVARDFVLRIEGYNAFPQAILGATINIMGAKNG